MFRKLFAKLEAAGKKRLFDDLELSLFLIQVSISRIAFAQLGRRSKGVAPEAANLLVKGQTLHEMSFLGGDADNDENYGPSPNDLKMRRSGKALAKKLVKGNDLVRYASVLSLRTTLVMEPERALEIVEMIDWISSLGDVPNYPPNPDILRKLAHEMATLYCPDMLERRDH
jgi:hypothetical protein